jgi:hypothetical protein
MDLACDEALSATKKYFFLSSSFSIFNIHKGNRYEHSEDGNENEDGSEMEIELGFMMILIFNL